MILPKQFYIRNDVVQIARDLLGKYLFTLFDDKLTGGFITETEAYAGVIDKASHAYKNRRTNRTKVMYYEGGTAYIYLCYGIHSLFNIVTNNKNIPHAILIRGIQPTTGIETILKRTGKQQLIADLINGPGKVSKALGIHFSHSEIKLFGKPIWLEDRGKIITDENIIVTKRIGVDYAKEDASLPYRFLIK